MHSMIRNTLAATVVALSTVLSAVTTPASAQTTPAYPSKAITIIVPFAPGGGDDFIGRLFAQHLGESLGQPAVVENMPGAGGTIGYAALLRSPADGYRLVTTNSGQTIWPAFYPQLGFDPVEDFVPIGLIYKTPFGVTVAARVPAKNLSEFIAYAKANPGKLNFGSGGNGTANHIAGEIFKKVTGTDLVHVPFKGAGPSFIALLGGQIDVMFATMTTAGLADHNAKGTVRVLAVSGDRRSTSLPNVPTAAEAGVQGYDTTIWWGIAAPKGTPPDVIAKLNAELRAFLQKPAIVARMNEIGGIPLGTSPAEAKAQVAKETKELSAFVTQLGLKP